jgi:predicted enzyme related to lactoylglutathione lyase
MNKVGYFEIQSSNPEREVKFYQEIFGWKFIREPNVPISYYRIENAGINGGLLQRPAAVPGKEQGTNAYVCSVEVKNFDETEKLILKNNGEVALPKFPVPGKCWQGYFMDQDKNTFGIFEVDVNAGR